ncbi:hypothetical protein L3Q82_009574, partial [Scortum barcoo]
MKRAGEGCGWRDKTLWKSTGEVWEAIQQYQAEDERIRTRRHMMHHNCVQEFCAAAEMVLVPEQIRFPDEGGFREMA